MDREQLKARIWPWLQRTAAGVAWVALGLALAAWGLLQWTDRFWLGTLVAFGPRWVLLVPALVAAILAAFWRPRSLVPATAAVVIAAGPVMGLCLHWRSLLAERDKGTTLKLLTCNTQLGAADKRLEYLILREAPDVVLLQEWPSERPPPECLATDWQIARSGQLVVASRWPIAAEEPLPSPAADWRTLGLRCELATASGPVQLFCLHLVTPREGLEAVLSQRLDGLDDLAAITDRRQLDAQTVRSWIDQSAGPKLVAGDFNLTQESAIYRSTFGHLQNAFAIAGWGWGGTKFTRVHSVRIDHILADDTWQITRCKVGPDVGSDHRPVIADVAAR